MKLNLPEKFKLPEKLKSSEKRKFKSPISVKLEFKKRNYIFLAVALALAIVLYVASGYAIWMLPVFGAAFYIICSLNVTFSEKLPWVWTAIFFGFGSVFTTYCVQYLLLDESLFSKMTNAKWTLNILCVLAVYLFTLLFTNHVGRSCIITHSFFLLFGFVDYFVYLFRQNEFTFADLRAITTGLSVAGNYSFEITAHCAHVIMISIIYYAVVKKCNVRFSSRIHMSILTVLMTAICCLYVAYESDGINTETWEQKGTYRNGYILNFVLQIRDSFISAPDGYSAEAVAELEEMYSDNTGDSGEVTEDVDASEVADSTESDDAENEVTGSEDPTIIVIMNESFADLTVIGDFETNLPVTPFYDSLTENTIKGYALSSVFGAKTPNSEWEFQTGNTMAFLPSGSVVYQQYMNSEPTSIVSTLKNVGYTCVAMHPYYESGWSRNTVYPELGYDEMYFLDDFEQEDIIRKYVSDQELYEKIVERYESREEDEKLYLMGITMQNHGGYTTTYSNFEENYYKTGTSYTDLNQYLSLLHESDEALEYLVSYFEDVDEPVMIVFFGDHQPSLNSSFYKMLNGKGLSGLPKAELMDLYTVPFFIWTNYDIEEESVEMTSLNYLSTMALEAAGIELPAYNQFLADLMEVIPAINSRGYYSISAGKYQNLSDATGEEALWLGYYEILQYNSMFDKKNRSSVFFPYILDTLN
ncbi:MAG: LTA synthase family protein [Clostridiales bacterium]|nr:LTA synthase family protein [Clostridiales bacterium]